MSNIFCWFVVSMAFVAMATCVKSKNAVVVSWQENLKITSSFNCAKPVPRAVSIEELVKEYNLQNINIRKIQPPTTVLHRCGNAGCCLNAQQQCTAINQIEKELHFLNMAPARQRPSILKIIVKEDLACACLDRKDLPK